MCPSISSFLEDLNILLYLIFSSIILVANSTPSFMRYNWHTFTYLNNLYSPATKEPQEDRMSKVSTWCSWSVTSGCWKWYVFTLYGVRWSSDIGVTELLFVTFLPVYAQFCFWGLSSVLLIDSSLFLHRSQTHFVNFCFDSAVPYPVLHEVWLCSS